MKELMRDWIPLSKILRELKESWEDCPIHAIRKQVVSGKIPSRKSSCGSRARYFVKRQDIAFHFEQMKQKGNQNE